MVWQKILLLSLALFIENTSAFRKRILNGQTAKIEDFPYHGTLPLPNLQVSLQEEDDHFCGGAIIDEKHILTAGHCISKHKLASPYDGYTIMTGTDNLFGEGRQYEIANVTVHPGLQCKENRCVNDIAVITLKDAIVFDKYTKKIDLPKQNYEIGQKANVTGWGLVQVLPESVETIALRLLETKLISMEDCQGRVRDPKETPIYETEICAFHSVGTGACFGDSGGPMAVNGVLVGLVAWADGDYCGEGRPDVFTNVYKYLDYIKSVTS